MQARDTFDAVADLYGAVRPGYPAALFDDLAAVAGLTGASRVLEVGCGAGQATGDLAARAGRTVALDPGPALIDQARARVPAANVDFVVSGFEGFEAGEEAFDLVVSAQAWHWISPQIAYPKAAQILAPGGSLAVFGHVPLPVGEPFASAFEAAFAIHAPGVWGTPPPQTAYLESGPFAGQFAASGLFGPVIHRAYPWTWTLTAETFGAYLRTDSSYHFLPEAPRFALFDLMTAAVAENGGVIEAPWETHLYWAAKDGAGG
ncbi:MAG: class I SAM-dependent methyltransferase [Caulobacteraceae bacterium]|nr:class I SAM-dependent methyltransferase [Caulobacteraceae bacterium]